ncbi:hypothetical protein PVAP13_7NG311924 [Panicum virgatum]|uniref:Uncharacterized protein n=1 Tax=Panicum virgatum TaxID=38727 RepID=A0A8T0Q5F7_PANVG|nr:hypothetical protein PVAP13_7NG311924 [Panicum virgatum]
MRSSLLPVALLAVAAAACLAHAGAEPAAPRRSLAVDPTPTRARSDWDWCWESLLTLGLCKHDLLVSFFAGRPAPRACCVAADEAVHHCGPFTRAFIVGSLLPHGPLAQCALPEVTTGSPATWPDARVRAPPRAPALQTGPRASGGAPPPLAATGASSGTPGPKPEMTARPPPLPVAPPPSVPGPQKSFRIPPPLPPPVSAGTRAASPKAASGTRAPAVPGGARRDAVVRGAAPPVPAQGNPPKPKVIAGGSAGAPARRAPDAYGAGAGAPLAATAAPRKGVPAARPSP